jgi:hypothetical protein
MAFKELTLALVQLVRILLPLLKKAMDAMKDAEVRKITEELKNAKTAEEKREAARKIADSLYKS